MNTILIGIDPDCTKSGCLYVGVWTLKRKTIMKLPTHVQIYEGGINPSFLADVTSELKTFYTPKKIIEFVKNEELKCIIGNPKFKT